MAAPPDVFALQSQWKRTMSAMPDNHRLNVEKEKSCPSYFDHTPCPSGYIQWHAWAKQMARTHRQVKCGRCGLWAIWIPKKSRSLKRDHKT